MTATPEAKTKPPFLRRRWPYFALGFLLALPAPNLAWRAFERFWYGGPTTLVSVIEIDRDFAGPQAWDRIVQGYQTGVRMSDGNSVAWDRVKMSGATATIGFRYVDRTRQTTREGETTINLDLTRSECLVLIRHRPDRSEITPCLPGVPRL